MLESRQEGYRTLGWIVNKSEQGIYLAVADEEMQGEIVRIYRQGAVGVYDYMRHPGAYSFRNLQEWVSGLPEIKTFFLANFHLAVQNEESLKRLNFSRDMLEGLGKNLIFLVTPYWDDRLATGAYDFYSFIKLRVMFHNYETGHEDKEELLSLAAEPEEEREWNAEEAKQKLAKAYELLEQATEERDRAHYRESVELLLKAREIREKLLGPEHLEVARIYQALANVYYYQGKYGKAEELSEKSLRISEIVLGEEHPNTVAGYNNLAVAYKSQGKYEKAEELSEKSLRIRERVLGEEHPDTAASYNNLAAVYKSQGKYREAEELYEKSLRIRERVLGEEHPDTAIGYNNLAGVYKSQGKYREAEELYEKSLRIRERVLGEEHPDTAIGYNNLAGVYESQGKYKMAIPYFFKAYIILLDRLGIDHPHTQVVYDNLKYTFGLNNPEGNFEQWIAEHASSD